MAQWLVTQGKNQFAVDGLGKIQQLLRAGDLRAGDLIQPPGTTDWLYVLEVPELRELATDAGQGAGDDDLAFGRRRGTAVLATGALAALFVAVIVLGGGAMVVFSQQLPGGNERMIGSGGLLSFSEMIVTETGTGLRSSPDANAAVAVPAQKDQVVELLSKRGDFYKARTRGGQEGWIPVDHVIPIYQLGGADVRDEYDPLYNPDRYFEVANGSWQQLPDHEENTTVFEFMLQNLSRYPMTDLVIQATIKDSRGHELEKVEIPIEGIIPAEGRTMVGTLAPPDTPRQGSEESPEPRKLTEYTFQKMAEKTPDLQLNYSAGVEATVTTKEFAKADIDPLELRAIPDEEAIQVVRREQ